MNAFIVLHSTDPDGPVVIDPSSISSVSPARPGGFGAPSSVVALGANQMTNQVFFVTETVEEIIALLQLQAVNQ